MDQDPGSEANPHCPQPVAVSAAPEPGGGNHLSEEGSRPPECLKKLERELSWEERDLGPCLSSPGYLRQALPPSQASVKQGVGNCRSKSTLWARTLQRGSKVVQGTLVGTIQEHHRVPEQTEGGRVGGQAGSYLSTGTSCS